MCRVEHTIEFVDGGGAEDVVVRTSGRGILSGFTAYLNELVSDPRYRPGMTILVDHTALDASGLATADARTFAGVVADLGDRIAGTAISCVAPSAVMYGISRAFEAYAEASGLRTRVFATVDEARAWLADAKQQPS
jgi:hypothetical protein